MPCSDLKEAAFNDEDDMLNFIYILADANGRPIAANE